MRCVSLAHAPKSIKRHRSLQKGRNLLFASTETDFLHCGQATMRVGCIMFFTFEFISSFDSYFVVTIFAFFHMANFGFFS